MEIGLIHASRGEYGKMAGALGKAVKVGGGGLRAYLGEPLLGDALDALTGATAADRRGDRTFICRRSHGVLGTGRDRKAAVML